MPHRSGLPFLENQARQHGYTMMSEYDLSELHSWGRILSVYDAPSQTSHGERLFIFGLIMAKRPQRVLEIGFRFGGTSFLMLCALEDCGGGNLVALDPAPEPVLDFSRFGNRFELIRGRSPRDLPRAIEALGGPVDFCFVDGDHRYEAVLADLEALFPHMSDESYILMHDAVRDEVRDATYEFIGRHRGRVIDCGLVSPWTSGECWSGLRLLRIAAKL